MIKFMKSLQAQMKWEEEHDNDCQASPRFWVLRDRRTVPTHEDYADRISYYFNNGDVTEFETVEELQRFLSAYDEDFEYFEVSEEDWNYYTKNETVTFGELWRWVTDNLNEEGFFNEVPVIDEYFIVPNTLFLTKKEAKEYIEKYGYNHTKHVHTYAMTAIRSPQVEQLFHMLHNFDWIMLEKAGVSK